MRNPFVKPLVRQAILTFDDGSRIRAEVTLRLKRWYTHADYERGLVAELNNAQPNAVHKITKVHLMRS